MFRYLLVPHFVPAMCLSRAAHSISADSPSGNGTTSLANDETYTWACCRELTAFSDIHGTASLSYNDLGRMTSFTDTQGNQVQYEYDSRGRTSKVTPAQGSSYRTEYQYNLQGALSKVRVYDSAAYADTDYTYSATTGKLTQRDEMQSGGERPGPRTVRQAE